MSYLDETLRARLQPARPGQVRGSEPGTPASVSIDFGDRYELWFSDATDLRALRDAADAQLQRLQAMHAADFERDQAERERRQADALGQSPAPPVDLTRSYVNPSGSHAFPVAEDPSPVGSPPFPPAGVRPY